MCWLVYSLFLATPKRKRVVVMHCVLYAYPSKSMLFTCLTCLLAIYLLGSVPLALGDAQE